MHLSPKAVVVVAIILLVCGAATASEITHDWSFGGWVNNGIGFVGMKHGDGTVETEFRYGHGAFDYIKFPFHIYWVIVIANLPILFGIAFYLMRRCRRRYANAA